MIQRTLLLACLLATLCHPLAAEVPAQRLTSLSRGVNLIDVFAEKKSHLDDVAAVKRAGFRHIRFFVDPAWVWQAGEPQRLDGLLKAAFAAKLGVIICMHSYVKEFADDPQLIANWTAAWLKIAQHYADTDPELLYFELVNEPPLKDVARWTAIQETLRQEVRAVVPRHTLMLTGAPTSTSMALAQLPPSSDTNVVYTFHVYAPMVFSHQGADWADPDFGTIRNLQYPPSQPNLSIVQQKAAPKRQTDLSEYGKLGAAIIPREVEPAVQWAKRNRVPLMVTEFGVYRPAAPPASRATWLRDVRSVLERHRIGWTVWEYDGGFGIKSDIAVGCGPVPHALGLC